MPEIPTFCTCPTCGSTVNREDVAPIPTQALPAFTAHEKGTLLFLLLLASQGRWTRVSRVQLMAYGVVVGPDLKDQLDALLTSGVGGVGDLRLDVNGLMDLLHKIQEEG